MLSSSCLCSSWEPPPPGIDLAPSPWKLTSVLTQLFVYHMMHSYFLPILWSCSSDHPDAVVALHISDECPHSTVVFYTPKTLIYSSYYSYILTYYSYNHVLLQSPGQAKTCWQILFRKLRSFPVCRSPCTRAASTQMCKVQGKQRHVDKSYFASSGHFLYADLLVWCIHVLSLGDVCNCCVWWFLAGCQLRFSSSHPPPPCPRLVLLLPVIPM